MCRLSGVMSEANHYYQSRLDPRYRPVYTCDLLDYSTLLAAPLLPFAAEKLSFSFVPPGATDCRGVPILDPLTVDASPSPNVLSPGCSAS